MKFLSFLLMLCSCLNVFGQESLLSSEMPPIGSVIQYNRAKDPSVVRFSMTGTNVTWDFSMIEFGALSDDFLVMDPADTPYGADFPNSNYVLHDRRFSKHEFYDLNDSTFELVGLQSSSIGGNGLRTYTDPLTILTFPLELGVDHTDDYDYGGPAFSYSYRHKWVGEGKLILPDSSFDHVLLVDITNSGSVTVTARIWYSADNGMELLIYSPGTGQSSPYASYLSGFSKGTGTAIEKTHTVSSIRFSNPVQNTINMNVETTRPLTLGYALSNISGQVLEKRNIENFQSQNHSLKIEVGRFSSGLYFLTLFDSSTNQPIHRVKWIKE